MKIRTTGIIKLKKPLKENTKKFYGLPVIFTAIFAVGIIIGVILISTGSSLYDDSLKILNQYLDTNSHKSFGDVFTGNLLYNLFFIVLPMFLGLSAAGFPFVYFIPFFKGLGVGATGSLIYISYGIKGVGYCMLIIFPVALVQAVAIMLACDESHKTSSEILSIIKKENIADEEIRLNLFFLRYLIITLIILFSSILYAAGTELIFRLEL